MRFVLAAFFYLASTIYPYSVVSLTISFNSGILFQEVIEDEIYKSSLIDFSVCTHIH